jgi:exosortase
MMISPIDNATFVGCLLGCTMIVGGWPLLKWAGPPIAFLLFMFKFPSFIEHSVLLKLQQWASTFSTFTLQTIGVSAIRDGNRIQIAGLEQGLEVADACSGLRMSTIFGAMSVALAMIVNRPWWDRLTIPIALLTNIIRITVTALIFMMFPDSDAVHDFVHGSAGWAMMPVAMGFLWIELQLLNHISVPIEDETQYNTFGTVEA